MADGISIRSLRVSAELDARGYVEGARQKAAADQAMTESGKAVSASVTETQRKIAEGSRAVDALQRSIDPAFAAQQRLERGTGTLNRALESGRIGTERHAQLMDLLTRRYASAAPAASALAGAFGRSGAIIQQAGYQIGDFAVQIASGQSAMRAFTQQGSQLLGFFGPWGAAAGAAVAVGGALAATFVQMRQETESLARAEEVHAALLERIAKLTDDARGATVERTRAIEAERRHLIESTEAEIKAAKARLDAMFSLDDAFAAGPAANPRYFQAYDLLQAAERRLTELRGAAGQYDDATTGRLGAKRSDYFDDNAAARDADEVVRKSAESLTALITRYDEAAKRAHDFWSVQGELNKALDEGRITGERHAELMAAAINTIWKPEPVKAQTAAIKENTTVQRERASALDSYVAGLRDQLTLQRHEKEERGEIRALIEAQDRAQRDYADGLRDTPLLREEEVEVVRALQGDIEGLKDVEAARTKAIQDNTKAREEERRAIEKAQEDFSRRFERSVDNVVDISADIFYEAFSGRIDDIGELLKTTLLRSVSQGLAEAFVRPLASTIVGSFIGYPAGGVPGFAGGYGTAAGGGTAGGLGLFPNLGLASSIFAPGNILTGGMGFTGSAIGGVTSTGPAGLFGTQVGILGALAGAGLGWGIGSIIPSVTGRQGPGNQIGGALGGLAGTFLGGPLGALAGGALGGLFGGLFGKRESVGPGQAANLGIGSQLGLSIGDPRADNGGNAAAAASWARAIGDAALQIIRAAGGTSLPADRVVHLGSNKLGFNVQGTYYATQEEAQSAALRHILANGVGGISGGVNTALQRSVGLGNSPEQILADVEFAKQIERLNLTPVERSVAEINDRYREQIERARLLGIETSKLVEERDKEIAQARSVQNDERLQLLWQIELAQRSEVDRQHGLIAQRYDELIKKARELGVETSKLIEIRDKEIAAVRAQAEIQKGQVELGALQQVGAATAQIGDFLNAQALGGASTLSPEERVSEAQRQFGLYLDKVRGGDLAATGALTQSAGALLEIGRENYASTVDFANIERFVRSSLGTVAQQISSQQYIADRIDAAMKAQTGEVVDQLKAIRAENERVRREIELMRQQIHTLRAA